MDQARGIILNQNGFTLTDQRLQDVELESKLDTTAGGGG